MVLRYRTTEQISRGSRDGAKRIHAPRLRAFRSPCERVLRRRDSSLDSNYSLPIPLANPQRKQFHCLLLKTLSLTSSSSCCSTIGSSRVGSPYSVRIVSSSSILRLTTIADEEFEQQTNTFINRGSSCAAPHSLLLLWLDNECSILSRHTTRLRKTSPRETFVLLSFDLP